MNKHHNVREIIDIQMSFVHVAIFLAFISHAICDPDVRHKAMKLPKWAIFAFHSYIQCLDHALW